MGRSHGKIWTEELIIENINKVIKDLDLERMPSKSECEIVFGDSSLTNKISKTGGFYYWAKRLGIKIKDSETKTGFRHESMINEILSKKYKSELTPVNFPYDILVEDTVKIDVKYSNLYSYTSGEYYSCNLEYIFPKSDLIIFVCQEEKILVIPSHILYGIKQLSVGNKSKYNKYIDRWDLVDDFVKFYKSMR